MKKQPGEVGRYIQVIMDCVIGSDLFISLFSNSDVFMSLIYNVLPDITPTYP